MAKKKKRKEPNTHVHTDLHDIMCAQTKYPKTLATVTIASGRNEQACRVLLLFPLSCNVSLLDVRGSGRIQSSLTPRKQPENWNSDSLKLLQSDWVSKPKFALHSKVFEWPVSGNYSFSVMKSSIKRLE